MSIGQLVSMVIKVLSRWMIELGASSPETLSFPFLLKDWSLPLGTAQICCLFSKPALFLPETCGLGAGWRKSFER